MRKKEEQFPFEILIHSKMNTSSPDYNLSKIGNYEILF